MDRCLTIFSLGTQHTPQHGPIETWGLSINGLFPGLSSTSDKLSSRDRHARCCFHSANSIHWACSANAWKTAANAWKEEHVIGSKTSDPTPPVASFRQMNGDFGIAEKSTLREISRWPGLQQPVTRATAQTADESHVLHTMCMCVTA